MTSLPKDRVEPDRTGTYQGLSLTGFHDVAYVDWGAVDSDVPVICVHGLTRQGRDFDFLAAELSAFGRRVVCPDLVGRGRSGRLRNPDEYALPQYCADMNALLAHLGAGKVDWVGTSLGGLIGIVLAGMPGSPIRRLVINDIGPFLPWAGLARVGSYVSAMPPDFRDPADAEAYFRDVMASYGDLPERHWNHIARHSIEWDAELRRHVMLCDPQIVRAFRNPWHYSLDLWKYWSAIDAPILIVRGSSSDMLSADLARDMVRRVPAARIIEIDGCGHAPSLMSDGQISGIADFLNGHAVP